MVWFSCIFPHKLFTFLGVKKHTSSLKEHSCPPSYSEEEFWIGHGLSSSHIWKWELDHKESWAPKNWCFWTVVLEDSWESFDCKEIKPDNPKGNQSWLFNQRTDAEAETPILRPSDVKNWLIGKDPNDGKNWRQEEKGMTEDEMVGWRHRLYGQEFEQARGVGDGQGNLACCSPWDHKELDMTEQLNWTGLLHDHDGLYINGYKVVCFHTKEFSLLGPCPLHLTLSSPKKSATPVLACHLSRFCTSLVF